MNKIDLDHKFKGIRCVRMKTEKYEAVIAPLLGAAVLRFRDNKNNLEIFRYNDNVSINEIKSKCEIWGLPTLYLPNRFRDGLLKTSDNIYIFPINEPLNNTFLHGWVHKREHKIESFEENGEFCKVTTSFTFDKRDKGNTAQRLLCRYAVRFFVRLPKSDAVILPYFKEDLGDMTENLQVDVQQSRQAVFVRYCLKCMHTSLLILKFLTPLCYQSRGCCKR